MKKKLWLLSALGLAAAGGAGAAMAQSQVILFGVVDVGVQHTRTGDGASRTGLSNGGLATSRLGFRGREDLGGGWYAGFWLEGSLNPDTGTGRAGNTNNQPSGATAAGPISFDRMSYLSLGSVRWGELRLGRDFTPTHYSSVYFDPFNANGVARAGNLTFATVGAGPLPITIVGSNTLSYWLPEGLGGFYGMAMVGLGENPRSDLLGAMRSRDGDFAGVRLGFKKGPFDVAAAFTRTRYASTATLGDYRHANLGASWDAGFARFFALYNRVTVRLTDGQVSKNTAQLGAHVPIGQVGRLRLSYAWLDDRSDAALTHAGGLPLHRDDARQIGVGYVHTLSRRTALYGSVAQVRNKGQARYVVSGGVAPAAGRDSTGWELGVRHSF